GVERVSTSTEKDGSFRFSSSEPGRIEIVFAPPSETSIRRMRFEVPRGLTSVPDLVVRAGGTIAGKVSSVSGMLPDGAVRLRALDGSGFEMRSELVDEIRPIVKKISPLMQSNDSEAGERLFRFDRVPPGRFELSVSELWRASPCSPTTLEVQA